MGNGSRDVTGAVISVSPDCRPFRASGWPRFVAGRRTLFVVFVAGLLTVVFPWLSIAQARQARPDTSAIDPDELRDLQKEDDRRVNADSLRAAFLRSDTLLQFSSRRDSLRARLMERVVDYIGTLYRYGKSTRQGMDCSAFTSAVFAEAFGITLPRSSRDQYRAGSRVKKSELLPGDLVFFRTRRRRISHVGIYVGENLFAHAGRSEGVSVSSLESSYYKKRYVGAKRILDFDEDE